MISYKKQHLIFFIKKVNAGAGARSTISGILSSIIVMISLVLFTKILYHLPVANLGGVKIFFTK